MAPLPALPRRGDVPEPRRAAGDPVARAAGSESVHLSDWPLADEALIDRELSDSVRLVQRLASLGRPRAPRRTSRCASRLQTVYVKLQSPDEAEDRCALLADQLLEELNVKELDVIEDDADLLRLPGAAQPARARPEVRRRRRPHPARPRPRPTRRDRREDGRAGRPVDLDGFSCSRTSCWSPCQGKPGYAVAEEAGYAVAVTTEITPELADEGLARELVRRIQEMRKNAGFEISDRIRLDLRGRRRHRARDAAPGATTSPRRRWQRPSRLRRRRRPRTRRSTSSTGARWCLGCREADS